MWEFQRNRNTCGQQAAAAAELDGGAVTMGTKKTYLEKLLPGYLKKDLAAYKKGLEENSSLLDCLVNELQGSINSAFVETIKAAEKRIK